MADYVNTMKELRDLPPGTMPVVILLGYHSAGDGGGGIFFWNSDSKTADNRGTIICPNQCAEYGRWQRMIDEPLSVRWFGARGVAVHADADPNDEETTVAIQAALSAAGPGQAVYIPPGTYVVKNLVVGAEQVLYGAGRDQSILKGKPDATGAMLTDAGSGVKIILRDFGLFADCVRGYTDIISLGKREPKDAPFGTEGYLANLWLRDAPNATGLKLYANVGYGYNITIQNVREGFRCEGNGNIFNTVTVGGCSGGEGYHSVFLQGTDIHGLHIEAPESYSVPLYFDRASSVTGCSISLANDTTFDHIIEIDPQVETWHLYHLTYHFGTKRQTVRVKNGNIRLPDGKYGGGKASCGSLSGDGSWTNRPPLDPRTQPESPKGLSCPT